MTRSYDMDHARDELTNLGHGSSRAERGEQVKESEVRAAIAKVINDEGGEPGNSIHSWRCEYVGTYQSEPCTCVTDIAQLIIDKLVELARSKGLTKLPEEPEVEEEPVPFVAIGHGEDPPWIDLPNDCPVCGAKDLPLEQSDPPLLQFISHCGQSWVRGQMLGGRL